MGAVAHPTKARPRTLPRARVTHPPLGDVTMSKTKTAPKGKPDARPAATPAELRELVWATLAEYFPRCEHATVAFVPAPGAPPLELRVAGDLFGEAGLSDDWYSGDCNANYWRPDDE